MASANLKIVVLAAALALLGCKKGDGVIVVAVGANPPVTNVASLHVTMTVGKTTKTRDVTPPSTTIANASDTTFYVDVAAAIGAAMDLQVDANDSAGHLLATGGAKGIAIVGGKRSDVMITLTATATTGSVCLFENPGSTFDHCFFAP
jgi:hypothetical protein